MRFEAKASGLFKSVELDRGRAMSDLSRHELERLRRLLHLPVCSRPVAQDFWGGDRDFSPSERYPAWCKKHCGRCRRAALRASVLLSQFASRPDMIGDAERLNLLLRQHSMFSFRSASWREHDLH